MSEDPWFLKVLDPDVVLAAAVMNSSLRGAEAVAAQVRTVVSFYRDFKVVYSGEFGDRRINEYTAVVAGRPLTGIGTFHLNEKGLVDEIVINHRPLSAALTVSRLLGESESVQRHRDEFFHPDGQTHEDLLRYSDEHEREL
jgi:hypothetical protein